jgi:hypothetical protein
VLFLLGRRNGGVRLLRGWEERLRRRARLVHTIHASLDKVGLRGGGVGYGKYLDIGIPSVIGRILHEVSIIKEGIKVAHYAMKVGKKRKDQLSRGLGNGERLQVFMPRIMS